MSTKEKTKPADEETEEAKGGKKKKMMIILAVAVLVLGAAAYFFLFSGSAKAAAPEPGTVVPLDPIAVNLAGGGYLKIGIALQLTKDAGETAPDGSKALDEIISTFSQAAPADITGARDALKQALEKKIVDAYKENGTEIVMGIYYTDYVTQ